MEVKHDLSSVKENYVEVNGINLYYQEIGEGYPLILIHGGAGTATFNWEKHLPLFSKHFRVIAPDSRGHGKTENPTGEFSYKLMVDDFAELIRKLELERPLVCGYSDGGQIALELGINHPTLAQAIVAGGATSILTDTMKETMNSWGVKKPGEVDFDQLEKQFGKELLALLSSLHAPFMVKSIGRLYGQNYPRCG